MMASGHDTSRTYHDAAHGPRLPATESSVATLALKPEGVCVTGVGGGVPSAAILPPASWRVSPGRHGSNTVRDRFKRIGCGRSTGPTTSSRWTSRAVTIPSWRCSTTRLAATASRTADGASSTTWFGPTSSGPAAGPVPNRPVEGVGTNSSAVQ